MKRLRKYLATALILCSLTLPAQNDSTWVGQWITAADCQNTPNTWIILRKTVSIDQVPEPFEARIAADSKYWMWINDSLVVFEGGCGTGTARCSSFRSRFRRRRRGGVSSVTGSTR